MTANTIKLTSPDPLQVSKDDKAGFVELLGGEAFFDGTFGSIPLWYLRLLRGLMCLMQSILIDNQYHLR